MRQDYGLARRLSRRGESQPRPPRKETKTTYGSNRPEPTEVCQRKHIQAPAKQQNPCKQQPACAAIDRTIKCENEQRDGVYELIKHGPVPNIDHPPPFKGRSQSVRAKCSQCDCQETKHRCDSKEQNRHVVSSSDFAVAPTLFSNRSTLIACFGESF